MASYMEDKWEGLTFILLVVLVVMIATNGYFYSELKNTREQLAYAKSCVKDVPYLTDRNFRSDGNSARSNQTGKPDDKTGLPRVNDLGVRAKAPVIQSEHVAMAIEKLPVLPVMPDIIAVEKTEETNCWAESGRDALASCHRGNIVGQASILRTCASKCILSQIEPRFTVAEMEKYVAIESLEMCRQGQLSPYAEQLFDAVFVYNVDCELIDPTLTEEEVIAFRNDSVSDQAPAITADGPTEVEVAVGPINDVGKDTVLEQIPDTLDSFNLPKESSSAIFPCTASLPNCGWLEPRHAGFTHADYSWTDP